MDILIYIAGCIYIFTNFFVFLLLLSPDSEVDINTTKDSSLILWALMPGLMAAIHFRNEV